MGLVVYKAEFASQQKLHKIGHWFNPFLPRYGISNSH